MDPRKAGGGFGHWDTDEWGLPAYHYTCNHLTDPQAVYLAMGKEHRRHWHQLGNDRIIAIGDNDGCVQVYQGEGGAKWLNFHDPDENQFAGGLSYLTDGTQIWGTHFGAQPAGYDFSRIFGIGYFRKIVTGDLLTLDQHVFAPFGDHPLLLSQVRIDFRGQEPADFDLFEYWGHYLYQLAYDAFITSYASKDYKVRDECRKELARQFAEEITYHSDRQVIVSTVRHPDHSCRPEGPHFHDLQPPKVFLIRLNGQEPTGWTCHADEFLGAGSRQAPGAVSARRLSRGTYSAAPDEPRRGCMVLQHPVRLEPGKSLTVTHAFGYLTEDSDLDAVLSHIGRDPHSALPRSMEAWKKNLPAFGCPDAEWAGREAVWNGYHLRAGSSCDTYFKSHILSQGCTYQYQTGFNAAARDPLQHALPAVLFAPGLVKDTLRYTLREQNPRGTIPYAICGHGMVAPVHWRPSDNDLWLLWLSAEYLLATRDTDFLSEEIPFYPREQGQKAPVIDHLRLALTHLLEKVGRGRHGLLKIKNGDWNDGIMEEIPTDLWTQTMQDGETVLNSAMAAYVLTYAGELFQLAGDEVFAERSRGAGAEIADAVRSCWTGEWFLRVFACDHDGQELWVGRDRLFLEPQPWALIAGIPDERQSRRLIANLDGKLRAPSPIGALIAHPPREKVMQANLDLDPDGGNLFWGGSWYALNGTLIWALGRHDPGMAWDELFKNSFAAHAAAYPHVWFGIWSGPDCYNGPNSERPGYTWGQGTFVDMNEFPVMCLHAHAWPLYALMKLCGVRFSARSISIHPRLPHKTFRLSTPLLGIRYATGAITGHYAPLVPGQVEIRLQVPEAWKNRTPQLQIDEQPATCTLSGNEAVFTLSGPNSFTLTGPPR